MPKWRILPDKKFAGKKAPGVYEARVRQRKIENRNGECYNKKKQGGRPMYDFLIRGARVVDGTGAAPVLTDVAIEEHRIAAVGDLKNADARCVTDARGRFLTP